jgi:hypothetical protein
VGPRRPVTGQADELSFAPALVEIEEALVPAVIVKKLKVLVPPVPTLMAGSLYILPPRRVHPVDVPFTVALKVFSKWVWAPVNSSGPFKRQSHPRPRRRPPDQPGPEFSYRRRRLNRGRGILPRRG